ncbi:putative dihydroorotate dehydrogenase [Trypanosoma cruzi]|uniref:Putative dihydroorotate dehydrogenase n=1 Tax=Trypanosoma cruzi TaxID=5693 RepID=A0A2V2W3B8_TRYCR|nr:putative dihydroorotate dehydrogenase [Trypanosoma cruzi]
MTLRRCALTCSRCRWHMDSLCVKMPPYFDIAHFDTAAAVLNEFPLVKFVTCVNSVGNGLVIDAESESVVIKPKQGFGGLGGKYILPTALANVNAFYRRCPDKLSLAAAAFTAARMPSCIYLPVRRWCKWELHCRRRGPAFLRVLKMSCWRSWRGRGTGLWRSSVDVSRQLSD